MRSPLATFGILLLYIATTHAIPIPGSKESGIASRRALEFASPVDLAWHNGLVGVSPRENTRRSTQGSSDSSSNPSYGQGTPHTGEQQLDPATAPDLPSQQPPGNQQPQSGVAQTSAQGAQQTPRPSGLTVNTAGSTEQGDTVMSPLPQGSSRQQGVTSPVTPSSSGQRKVTGLATGPQNPGYHDSFMPSNSDLQSTSLNPFLRTQRGAALVPQSPTGGRQEPDGGRSFLPIGPSTSSSSTSITSMLQRLRPGRTQGNSPTSPTTPRQSSNQPDQSPSSSSFLDMS